MEKGECVDLTEYNKVMRKKGKKLNMECVKTPRFTDDELELLVDEVIKHKQSLFTWSGTNMAPKDQRKKIWDAITKKINSLGFAGQSWQQIKKRWHDIHLLSKKMSFNKREATKTGGGLSKEIQLTPLQERVSQLFSKVAIEGVGETPVV